MSRGPERAARVLAAFVVIGLTAVAWWSLRSHDAVWLEERQHSAETLGTRPQTSHAAPSDSRSAVVAEGQVAPTRPQRDEATCGLVRGRIVAAESGEALAGAQILLYGTGLGAAAVLIPSAEGDDVQSRSVIGGDGRFALSLPVHPRLVRSLEIRCAGRVTRRGLPAGWHAGELGDLPLERGFPVRGSVVDTQGFPAEWVKLRLVGWHPGRQLGQDRCREPMSSAASGRGGAFELAELVPAGRWQLAVEDRSRNTELLTSVEVVAEVGARDVQVIVDRWPCIQGTIVDEAGAPIDELYLIASRRDQDRIGYGRAQDGRFEVFLDQSVQPDAVKIGWWPGADGGDRSETEEWLEWGARDVRLVVKKRSPAVELMVFEADSGAPVEEFAVSVCTITNPMDHWITHRTACRRWPGGRARVEGWLRGDALVEVIPARRDLLVTSSLFISREDQARGPFRVGLARSTRFAVRVLRGDRTPVAGALVELIRVGQDTKLTHEAAVSDERTGLLSEGGPGGHTLVSCGMADASGRARLRGDRPGPILALRVRAPGHAPLLVDRFVVPPEDGESQVFVAEGAGLDLVIEPARVAGLHGARIVLRRQGADADFFPGRFEGVPLASDGGVRLRAVPPGNWRVLLCHAGNCLERPIGTVKLAEGETTRLELDLSHLAPARVRGTVTWSGAPPWSGSVILVREMDGRLRLPAEVRAALDGTGTFVAEGLLPGRYQMRAGMCTAQGVVHATSAGVFELAAGMDVTRVFDRWQKN